MVSPRSSLIISDEAFSPETDKGTDFIVVLSSEPQGSMKSGAVGWRKAVTESVSASAWLLDRFPRPLAHLGVQRGVFAEHCSLRSACCAADMPLRDTSALTQAPNSRERDDRPAAGALPHPIVSASAASMLSCVGERVGEASASSAALVTPAPTWGARRTPLAEQRDAAEHEPRRSEIMDRLEDRLRGTDEDVGDHGASSARASAFTAAMTSGRINGGGICSWRRPDASVLRSASAAVSVGRYQTML